MGDAPERIWAWSTDTIDRDNYPLLDTGWESDDCNRNWFAERDITLTEYLQADLAAAREADLRAEVERLKEEIAGWRTVAESNGVMAQSHCAEADRLRGLLDEAREVTMCVASSLAAAISLLERGGKAAKKAAPSDTMFDVMLNDYRTSFKKARATLAKIGGQHD